MSATRPTARGMDPRQHVSPGNSWAYVLSLLSDRCVRALDVTAAGVMLAAPSGALQVIASSSDAMRTLELFQLQSDQGPCLEAYRTGEQVVNLDLAALSGRWPRFAPRAAAEGFRSAHSFPMRLRRRTPGALNLLRSDPGALEDTDISAAQALADIASIAIIQHQVVVDAQTLNSRLSAALNSRVVIEQAKGKIAQATGSDMDHAFRQLRSQARNHNLRLADLARQARARTRADSSNDPNPARVGAAKRASAQRCSRPRWRSLTTSGRELVHTTATVDASNAGFRQLAQQVRAAGLLDRRPAYYRAKIGLTVAAFAAGWAAFAMVGDSWATLGLAALLGVMSTQLGFIGHDAGHQQVFGSRRANRLLGLAVGNVLIGLCFGWWVPKHGAHHAHPNEVGRDPDIGDGLVALPRADARGMQRKNLAWLLARWQAPLFFPLMVLRSVGLHVSGIQHLLRRHDRGAAAEALLVALHMALFFTVVLVVLSPLKALAFVAVEQAVFSFYLGCSFAPNHKAMPIIPADAAMGFARRQVVTARNITGGWLTTFVLGGLNYQIEHHLFPSMPRPNLTRAQNLVRDFCLGSDLGYCETSLQDSFGRIVHHLRAAGYRTTPTVATTRT